MQRVARKVSVAFKDASTLVYKPEIEQDDIPEQARFLCYRYICRKLRRTSIGSGGFGQTEMFQSRVDDNIAIQICRLADMLEKLHPDTYSNLAWKLQLKIQSEQSVSDTFRKFADELFRHEIKWPLILSLLTVAGNLGIECALQGRSRFIGNILSGIEDVTKRRLRKWICDQGGWERMVTHFENQESSKDNQENTNEKIIPQVRSYLIKGKALPVMVVVVSLSAYCFMFLFGWKV